MSRVLDHFFILSTIFFGIYSQLIMRWQVTQAGQFPEPLLDKSVFILRLLLTPWVLSAMLATFLSGVSWIITMSKFEISYAYPWTSLGLLIIMFTGFLFFGETISPNKIIGTVLVMLGLIILNRH